MAQITKVSPLAPKGGFPQIAPIKGVRFAAAEAGVRYKGRLDVMLAVLDEGAQMAGVFTRSLTRSAPVLDCEAKLAAHMSAADGAGPLAIVVNSGNSNAFTGRAGVASVKAVTEAAAAALGTTAKRVYSASTGVIGEPLPHERITAALPALAQSLTESGISEAARAIMTTDTFAKGASTTIRLQGKDVTISGIAKGSGMIAPDMATMLVFLFTDVALPARSLQEMLNRLNPVTFNAITVDGDTSTSDSLLLAATGASGVMPEGDDQSAFEAALHGVMRDLAHQVVRDGEGATKFVSIHVSGADCDCAAQRIAMAIANSPLVKTAIAGEDPNWGRIVMAVGKSGEQADRDALCIRIGGQLVASEGAVHPAYDEAKAAAHMKGEEIEISVDVGISAGEATVWTCDLTHDYIAINADYRS